jgi:hypothetical protein
VAELAVFGLVLLVFGLVSKRLEGTPVTAPMVFAGAGLLVGAAGGDLGVNFGERVQNIEPTETARHIAELGLVLLLFTGAARIDVHVLRERSACRCACSRSGCCSRSRSGAFSPSASSPATWSSGRHAWSGPSWRPRTPRSERRSSRARSCRCGCPRRSTSRPG